MAVSVGLPGQRVLSPQQTAEVRRGGTDLEVPTKDAHHPCTLLPPPILENKTQLATASWKAREKGVMFQDPTG